MGDLEFVQKCVKGDASAWDEFVERYSRLIYNYIHSVIEAKGLSLSQQDNVREIFQDIFFLLVKDNFKKLKTFKAKNGCSLASWLRQVTINATLDHLRKTRVMFSLDAANEEDFSLKEILADESPLVREAIEVEEKFTLLKDCIDMLDIEDKYFMELHIYRGFELEELKGIFKVSRGAIDMRKLRIVGRLRNCFKNKGFIFR